MRRQIGFGFVVVLLVALCLAITGCSAKTYTVTFDANGGQGSMQAMTFEVGQELALTKNAFTKANCDFLGWALSKDATKADYTDGQSVKDLVKGDSVSVTLYAVWAPHTYTVSFDGNGGTGTMANQTFQVGAGQALSANAFQSTAGSFIGWALEKDAATAAYTDGQQVTDLAGKGETVTLYAVWAKYTYTVAFDGNGATKGDMLTQNMTMGQAGKLTANAFSKGWEFDFLGWSLDKDATTATYTDGQEVTDLAGKGETVTLYAIWAPYAVPDVTPDAADDLIVEDVNIKGNSDLQGDWTVKYYKDNWLDTQATLSLATGYDKTNAIKFGYWDNDNAYRYSIAYQTNADYDTLAFDLKGNGISNLTIQLANDSGMYMQYKLAKPADAVWTHYEISVFDENWTVNYSGQSVSVPEAIKALGLNDYYDLYKTFNVLHIIFKGSTSNGANGYSFMDNICFKQTGSKTGSIATILYDFGTNYTAALADGTVAQILFDGDKSAATVKTLNLKQNISVDVVCQLNGNLLSLDYTGFAAEATLVGNGEKIRFTSVSGDLAALLQDMEFGQVYVMDDFESYTATGDGVDTSMPDIWSTSGLRGGYYTEVYTGNESDSTLVGGKKWSWQKADVNYVALSDEAHSGSHAMQLAAVQQGNARYISMSTVKGGAASIGKGTTMGLWLKNTSKADIKIQAIKACYRDTVSNANINDSGTNIFSASKAVTLEANSGWTQVEVELNPEKDVYGFIIVVNADDNAVRSLLVDDVTVYSANPYATYVDPSSQPQMPEFADVNLDFQNLTNQTDYTESDWKREYASGNGFVSNSAVSMRVRQNVSSNNVLNMYTKGDQAYKYTYVGNGAGLGKANYFSIDLGNYFQTPSDIKIKLALVDTDGNVHYLLGSANGYDILSSTKVDGVQTLKTFEREFDEITVRSFFIEIKGTSGDQYVYMDNVILKYKQ